MEMDFITGSFSSGSPDAGSSSNSVRCSGSVGALPSATRLFKDMLLTKMIIFVIFPFLPSPYRDQPYWTLASRPWAVHFLGQFMPGHSQPSPCPPPSTLLFYPSSGPRFILLAESHLKLFQVTSDGSMNFISPAQRQRATRGEPTEKCSATEQVHGWGRGTVALPVLRPVFSPCPTQTKADSTTGLQHQEDLQCNVFHYVKLVKSWCYVKEKLAKARNAIWKRHTIEI